MTSWLYFRKKQHTSCYSCKFPLFLKDDHLNLEPVKKAGSCYNRNQQKNQMRLKAITMPPPPPDWAFAIFFFLGGLFPTPGYTGRDNSPPPSSWLTSYTIFSTSLYKSKTTHFHNFYEHFPELIYWESKDNGCHNAFKTWTINLKTKKKNFLVPPWENTSWEHVVLDQVSVSL